MTDKRYAKRGVSASKKEVHAAVDKLDKGLFANAFCKVLPDIAAGDKNWCNIMHADTAGTKTSLAYMYWRETGDVSVWRGVAQDALVMNLDDLACVGAVNDVIISSTIGRNKHLVPGEIIRELILGTQEFLDNMKDYGIRIHHSGGETADVGDIVRTADVGITAFARMQRAHLIVNDIKPGACIVGLASFGQAVYESAYNSGMGSNGLTSARHDVFSSVYAQKYPETYAAQTDASFIYSGSRKLTEEIPQTGLDLGKLMLSPTRTYLPVLALILEEFGPASSSTNSIAMHSPVPCAIQGIIHCSGGGQTKVLHFVDGIRIVKDNLFDLAPLFEIIQKESDTTWREMYRVFNMGHRLELYVDPKAADRIIEIAAGLNIQARCIGYVEPSEKTELRIDSANGTYVYHN